MCFAPTSDYYIDVTVSDISSFVEKKKYVKNTVQINQYTCKSLL